MPRFCLFWWYPEWLTGSRITCNEQPVADIQVMTKYCYIFLLSTSPVRNCGAFSVEKFHKSSLHMTSSSVKVALRIKPIAQEDANDLHSSRKGSRSIVDIVSDKSIMVDSRKQFTFDGKSGSETLTHAQLCTPDFPASPKSSTALPKTWQTSFLMALIRQFLHTVSPAPER